MSTFKKSSLAAAVVLGLGLATSAAAFTVTTGGDLDPIMVATADIADETTDIGVAETTTISLTGDDNILGRTTGFTLRIQLDNGAEFGQTLTTADLTIGADNNTWAPTIVAGGAIGDTSVVINMDPTGTPVALTTGALLNINAAATVVAPVDGGLVLQGLEALQAEDAVVKASVKFVDPNTAQDIMTATTVSLLKSGDPVVLACDDESGDTDTRIDVGSSEEQGAKTYFSEEGEIGGLNSGEINLGEVNTANNTVTFEYTGDDVGISADGIVMSLCAAVEGGNEVVIDDSSVSVTTTFNRGDVVSAGGSCNLLPLRYNGSVVEVYHINPAGNNGPWRQVCR